MSCGTKKSQPVSLHVGQLDRWRVLRFYRTKVEGSKNRFDGPAPVNDTRKPISQVGDEWDALVDTFSLTLQSEGTTWIAFSMEFDDISRMFPDEVALRPTLSPGRRHRTSVFLVVC